MKRNEILKWLRRASLMRAHVVIGKQSSEGWRVVRHSLSIDQDFGATSERSPIDTHFSCHLIVADSFKHWRNNWIAYQDLIFQ